MKKKSTIVLTTINIVLIVFFLLITLLMVIPLGFNSFSRADKPIFGHYLFLNTNTSMEPVMKQNDLVAVKPMPLTDLAVGDFLCYYPANSEQTGAYFGKITAIEGEELILCDKADHSVTVLANEIEVVGKASFTLLFLGDIVAFFQSVQNRILFYVVIGAVSFILAAVTVILHITLRREPTTDTPPAPPVAYSLDQLLEQEIDVEFEKSSQEKDE